MPPDNTGIKSITIGLPDGTSVEMTLQQAKGLHKELDALFGASAAVAPMPRRSVTWGYPTYRPDMPPEESESLDGTVWCQNDRDNQI